LPSTFLNPYPAKPSAAFSFLQIYFCIEKSESEIKSKQIWHQKVIMSMDGGRAIISDERDKIKKLKKLKKLYISFFFLLV